MIDNICLVTDTPKSFMNDISLGNPFYWKNILFKPIYHNGNEELIKCYSGDLENIKLIVYREKFYIKNSLHRFLKNENFTDFTFSELILSMNNLMGFLQLDINRVKVVRLEIGMNIELEIPLESCINSIISYGTKEFDKMKKGAMPYGKKCILTDYSLKVYNKTFQLRHQHNIEIDKELLRIEIDYNKHRPISFIQTVSDLCKIETLRKLATSILNAISKIVFEVDINFDDYSYRDIELYFAGMSCEFWKKLKLKDKENAKKRLSKFRQMSKVNINENSKFKLMELVKEKVDYLLNE